jgi:hypothetical protein
MRKVVSFLSNKRVPLSILSIVLMLLSSTLNVQAQCPSPAATTAPVTANDPSIGVTTTFPGSGSVTYVNGNVTLGTSLYANTVTISIGTTWVISSGSHLTVTNLNVAGTLIIQSGATVSVVGLAGANGILDVVLGGIIQMCENTGIENCGNTTFVPSPSFTYVGAAGGKAVVKAVNKVGFLGPIVGTLLMPLPSAGLTSSSNIMVAVPASNFFFPTPGGNYGNATACIIGSNCTALPFTVSASCGEFATQVICNAGTTAPALATTNYANICPATTVNLSAVTATNKPANAVLEWHSAVPVNSGNKITNISTLVAGTYYAVFYDAANNCYSNTSGSAGATTVTATVNACALPCNAGINAPTLSLSPATKANVCPTTTIDLTTITASNTPSASGVSLTWHTGTPATTANKITGTAVAAGTYYAAFFDAPNNCYSNGGAGTTAVTATSTPCCSFGSIAPILRL